jgi:membrane-associated phospholipid phosphatase
MRIFVFVLLLIIGLQKAQAQRADTLIHQIDSLTQKDSVDSPKNNTQPALLSETTPITFSSYFNLLGSDLKQTFTKPFQMKKKDWGTVGKFALAFGALALADQPVQRYAEDLRENNEGLKNVSNKITRFGGMYGGFTLGALGAYGFIFKNEKMKTTTLLASQAYFTGLAGESALKFLAGRQRPYFTGSKQVHASPTFHGPFNKNSNELQGRTTNNSFPSGHTTAAFAAATVYAMEYKDKPWVPVLAYSAASLIGVSRITENRHWTTDVLSGAALGYLSGRLAVHNYHRYASLKAQQKKDRISFHLQYNDGQLIPGLTYHFH